MSQVTKDEASVSPSRRSTCFSLYWKLIATRQVEKIRKERDTDVNATPLDSGFRVSETD